MQRVKARVLVVDDEPLLREFLNEALARHGYEMWIESGGEAALARAKEDAPDVILLDIKMKGRDGLSLLPEFRAVCPETQVLMMTGHGSLESAVQALRLGAFDYLTKPFSADAVELAVGRALSVGALHRENRDLRGQLSLERAMTTMVGRSQQMDELRSTVRTVAPSRSTILIQGESGTGKELVARAIHEGSPRANGPLVKINCAAVPAGLLESELFGHEKGSFTGAAGKARGRFEQANGGTLLLDEISEMDPALQPKLLRALQEREFYRVGGAQSVSVDVRVIATTNADLKARVREGSFREDLYFRLNVVPVRLVPLRERPEDIPVLAQHFLARFGAENGRPPMRVGRAALEALLRHDWSGNVRELMNAIERAVILCTGEELRPEHLLLEPGANGAAAGTVGGNAALGFRIATGGLEATAEDETLDAVEKAWILRILAEEKGNRTRAARRLEVSVRTIRNKLNQYARQDRAQTRPASGEEATRLAA
ncbi:MAG: sigma-54-dependent Fis family transcriptional regulator [Candidatus Eisenbacteria bacterium]|nr:sigma-54-dependent Fis family transcriptional regulator [Candidatus Eisenbacteria bacterium]